jgi:hypothetical protein
MRHVPLGLKGWGFLKVAEVKEEVDLGTQTILVGDVVSL